MNPTAELQWILMKALAGKEIQVRTRTPGNTAIWYPLDPNVKERGIWDNLHYEYRVKPESKVVPYKRYVYRNHKDALGVGVTWQGDTAFGCEFYSGQFVKWIDTEWQEYVVEES